jgi:hypothetical protein
MNKSVPNLRKVTPVIAKLIAIGLATDQTRVFNMALFRAGFDHLYARRFPSLPPVNP